MPRLYTALYVTIPRMDFSRITDDLFIGISDVDLTSTALHVDRRSSERFFSTKKETVKCDHIHSQTLRRFESVS